MSRLIMNRFTDCEFNIKVIATITLTLKAPVTHLTTIYPFLFLILILHVL